MGHFSESNDELTDFMSKPLMSLFRELQNSPWTHSRSHLDFFVSDDKFLTALISFQDNTLEVNFLLATKKELFQGAFNLDVEILKSFTKNSMELIIELLNCLDELSIF